MANAQMYNDPINGSSSAVGSQLRTDYYQKKALFETVKERYFGQLADVTNLPKHMGKTIKRYIYMPLLDDRNVNDQGIDASGATIANGNLYGSSKDIGTISGKLPALSETGGRVNRVGFRRLELEGTIAKFGFFDEYTKESMDFDTDEDLEMHIHTLMVRGANEMTEDALQIDLINGAGVIRYAGAATSNATIDETSVVTYGDLLRLGIDLDNNRTPKMLTAITGTRLVDTKVVGTGRALYVGSELIPTLMGMKDLHGEKAFIEVQHYAAGTTTLAGEAGSIAGFRVIVVPEMMKWEGEGDTSTSGAFHETGGKLDVLPMLAVGDKSFTTIGFQTDGKTVKFKIKHAKPESPESYALDPYGETGFMSIKWYYGTMILRAERIALVKTAAAL